jgi:hypothetical protein
MHTSMPTIDTTAGMGTSTVLKGSPALPCSTVEEHPSVASKLRVIVFALLVGKPQPDVCCCVNRYNMFF